VAEHDGYLRAINVGSVEVGIISLDVNAISQLRHAKGNVKGLVSGFAATRHKQYFFVFMIIFSQDTLSALLMLPSAVPFLMDAMVLLIKAVSVQVLVMSSAYADMSSIKTPPL
jgi:hypothetical protein